MAKKIDIGKLDSCLIVVDYNPHRSDDCDIMFYKDRNDAKKNGGYSKEFLDRNSFTIKDIISRLKKDRNYFATF